MDRVDLTGLRRSSVPLVTRFAPSPTGYLHLGHVVNAIVVWGIARAVGARVVLRLEDHDRIRCRPAYEDALLADLDWLGFEPDEGLRPLYRQQDRQERYERALAQLGSQVYVCTCSRREVGGEHYPGTCRQRQLPETASQARRVVLPDGDEVFTDLLCGPQRQTPATQCGDLLLRDRDGHWTYHFAVTVDDRDDGITLIIRGQDLLGSTGRQLQLGRMLGRTDAPFFVHHPLLMETSTRKLSKSDGATGIRELRAAGHTPEAVIGMAAAGIGLGVAGQRVQSNEVSRFWDRI